MVDLQSTIIIDLNFNALNELRFCNNFDPLDPNCNYGAGDGDYEHFLLHCPPFDLMRGILLSQLSEIPALDKRYEYGSLVQSPLI